MSPGPRHCTINTAVNLPRASLLRMFGSVSCTPIAASLSTSWDTKRVNHSARFYDKGVCTNQAESYFSRLRRMEVGTHHHIAGPYLHQYAGEASWREDYRRVANGGQAALVGAAAMAAPVSRAFAGYWQRGT